MAGKGKIISLAIALIFVASLIPMSISMVINANTTGWDTATLALWVILPVIAVIGLFILILKEAGVSV